VIPVSDAIDPRIGRQLDATRQRWISRQGGADWSGWVARMSAQAFRELAPTLGVIRIHSVPGTHWEVLKDSDGKPWLIADHEYVASLAELRLLSAAGAGLDRAYDRMALLLADGFQSCGNVRHHVACMGWLVQRVPEIVAFRRAAMAPEAHSAEALIVLLHEMAHHVLPAHPGPMQVWRDAAMLAIEKIAEALAEGPLREGLLRQAQGLGLDQEKAATQLEAYLGELRSRSLLREELTCDLLAALGFLNLRSGRNVLEDPQNGPDGVTTQEVGDAFLTAHGAIQNMQLISSAHEIAATALDPVRQRGTPDATFLQFTARSGALVHILSQLLRHWCAAGSLQDELAGRIAAGVPVLTRSVDKRNEVRKRALLEPLEELDRNLIDEQRFAKFEEMGLAGLQRAGIDLSRDRERLDSLRWTLTAVEPAAP
jgi:hypothetical protein